MNYIGRLPKNDPLYGYLRHDIFAQIGVDGAYADFRVYMMPASNHVYLYEDRHSRTRIIGKFFGDVSGRSPEAAFQHMEREFNNLIRLRSIGLTGYPHYVARPFGHNASLNHVLVEEFCYGPPLSDFILKAIREDRKQALFQKLTALSFFLADLHNRTAGNIKVDFSDDCSYFDKIMERLKIWGRIGRNEAEEFYRLKERWRDRGHMWEDRQVLVHGDVTPSNILFGDGLWVIARTQRKGAMCSTGQTRGKQSAYTSNCLPQIAHAMIAAC